MITMKIDKDDVQCNAEGKGIDITSEAGVAMVYIIRMIRDVMDDDEFIQYIIDFAIEQEKKLKR